MKYLNSNEQFSRLNWSILMNVKDEFDLYQPYKHEIYIEKLKIENMYLRVERQTFRNYQIQSDLFWNKNISIL